MRIVEGRHCSKRQWDQVGRVGIIRTEWKGGKKRKTAQKEMKLESKQKKNHSNCEA